MNTPSHLIMTAALHKRLRPIPIPRRAVLLGAVMPDVPFWTLSIVGGLYFRYGLGWSTEATARHMFDDLYFHDPGWMAAHNFLHSPTLLLIGIALLWRFRRQFATGGGWLYWFLVSCLFHSVVDILTHVNDGPLLLFPFNWSLRFHSPVSYWDPAYYGREFGIFELVLDILLLMYLWGPPLFRRLRSKAASTHTGT